ncbi:MAG: alpha/beta hydrolase [Pseudomonadota bacterium]
MKTIIWTIAAGLTLCAAATAPILAQRDSADRPSPGCIQEIVKLCRPADGEVRGCIKENFARLSDDCQSQIKARRTADDQLKAREQKTRAQAEARAAQRNNTVKITRTLFFGSHPNQQIDVYAPVDAVDDLPAILFVHGGGWSMGDNKYVQAKPAHFTANDYVFASTGYRLLPSTPVEEQARDVGAAVQALVGQSNSIGIDPKRIVLMGHSAGAHLAALVATDPKYAGDAFDAIQGVILLDGAGYDIASHMASAGPRSRDLYLRVFGNDPARQAALSPLTHVGGEDVPNWLALYVKEREASGKQAKALANALSKAGIEADALSISGTDHSRLSREMGTPAGLDQTKAVDAFLAAIFN